MGAGGKPGVHFLGKKEEFTYPLPQHDKTAEKKRKKHK